MDTNYCYGEVPILREKYREAHDLHLARLDRARRIQLQR